MWVSRDAPAACWLSSDSGEAGGCQENLRSFSETEGSLYLPAAELRSLLLLRLRTHYLAPRIYSLVSTEPSCREAEKIPKEGKVGGGGAERTPVLRVAVLSRSFQQEQS